MNNRYFKIGFSTQQRKDLIRRPITYTKDSSFIEIEIVLEAKSHQQGLKYEAYLFQELIKSKKFRWINAANKKSSRGICI